MREDAFNPATLVVAEIEDRLRKAPFAPFDIVMSNGVRYLVPSADHLTITRLLRRITLETDEPRVISVNPLHVAAIEDHKSAA